MRPRVRPAATTRPCSRTGTLVSTALPERSQHQATARVVAARHAAVVLTTRELGGEATEGADVLTFNDAGELVTFEAFGDTTQHDRVFAK